MNTKSWQFLKLKVDEDNKYKENLGITLVTVSLNGQIDTTKVIAD